MHIPDDVRKCVVFLGYRTADQSFRLAGTGWYAGHQIPGTGQSWSFLVTARHVIDGIRDHGSRAVWVRLNHSDSTAGWYETDWADWSFHPTDAAVDVAVIPAGLSDGMDHLMYPTARFATEEVIRNEGIGVGEELFLTGLFAHHFGQHRNIPIVRVGNIAAMPEEPVLTRSGSMEAYLVEARSIGGLSGSPVFVHLGVVRSVQGTLKYAQSGGIFYLLGLMHGHWDATLLDVDTTEEDFGQVGRNVNMGIGIVVPAWRISDAIGHRVSIMERNAVQGADDVPTEA